MRPTLGFHALSIAQLSYALINSSEVVDLGYAKYQGVKDVALGTTNFYGIYYAASPIGERRWAAPVDIEQANNYTAAQIIDASSYGPQCYQSAPYWAAAVASLIPSTANPIASEDCLLLDVIVPTSPKSSNLPVVVQIHGGGYTTGNSSSSSGSVITSFSNGSIVYVQIQYRLGPQGFLGGSAVNENGVANAGLLDQRAALGWVQRNIRSFGGDPSKVTIWGGSAGGGSVIDQLIMYGGQENPPFRAAIAEFPGLLPYHNNTVLGAQYSQLLTSTNCSTLACLRTVSSEELNNATTYSMQAGYESGFYGYGDFYYGPVVDGDIIKDLPTNELKQGHFSKVPLFTDRDGYEGLVFSNFSISTSADYDRQVRSYFPAARNSFFTRLAELYPSSNYGTSYFTNAFWSGINLILPGIQNNTQFARASELWGDSTIVCPAVWIANSFADAGEKAWKLNFYAGTELHGAVAAFFINPANQTGNATLASILKSYYLGFVIDLDPNADFGGNVDRPYWADWASQRSNDSSQVLHITSTSISMQADPDVSDRCDFWYSQGYSVPF